MSSSNNREKQCEGLFFFSKTFNIQILDVRAFSSQFRRMSNEDTLSPLFRSQGTNFPSPPLDAIIALATGNPGNFN